MRQTVHVFVVMVSLLAAMGPLACAFGEFRPNDPLQRQLSLEEQHKTYSDYVRWSKFEQASQFVDEAVRADYYAAMPSFDDVRFTDWEAMPWTLTDEELSKATIEVTYRGYSTRSMIEVAVHERQEWSRLDGNKWSLRSSFRDLDRLAAQSGR